MDKWTVPKRANYFTHLYISMDARVICLSSFASLIVIFNLPNKKAIPIFTPNTIMTENPNANANVHCY